MEEKKLIILISHGVSEKMQVRKMIIPIVLKARSRDLSSVISTSCRAILGHVVDGEEKMGSCSSSFI
eukprot:12900330-Ditylum_brightwellii.AAC.1